MPPVLIYLPGLDGTGRLLHRQTALHQSYHVLCEAYPQDRPTTYEDLAGQAAEHLARASAGRGGVVLAESFGGAVGLTLALLRPDLVQRLVLVNTFAYFPGRWRIGLAALLGRFFPARPSPPRTRGVRGPFFFAPSIPQAERDVWWDRTAGVPMRAYGYRLAMIAGLDLRPCLPTIDIPALVIAAPDDRVVPPKAGKELARLLPRATLIEPRAGHAALIHPHIRIAELLADARYWARPSVAATAAMTAATSAEARPG